MKACLPEALRHNKGSAKRKFIAMIYIYHIGRSLIYVCIYKQKDLK
jgi:hypothetical protein